MGNNTVWTIVGILLIIVLVLSDLSFRRAQGAPVRPSRSPAHSGSKKTRLRHGGVTANAVGRSRRSRAAGPADLRDLVSGAGLGTPALPAWLPPET